MRWVEMKCKCEVWSVGWEKCNVKCEESVCIVPGSRAGHVLGQQHCNSFAQSTHARAWLAHGACKFLSSSTGKWFMKAYNRWYMRRDEKRWAGIRWEELRWDEVWSVKGAVRSVGQEECSVKCGVWSVRWSVECEECSAKWKCGVWSVKCGVCGECSEKCEVRSGALNVTWKQDITFAECTYGLGWHTAHASSIVYR